MDDTELASELRTVLGRLNRQLRKQTGFEEYSWSQRNVLVILDRDGSSTLTALAAAEGMRPQSMRPIVASLEVAGLVTGMQDPNDGRQTILSLAPKAIELLREGRAAKDDWLLRAMTDKLSTAQRETLARAAPLLRRLVEPQETTP